MTNKKGFSRCGELYIDRLREEGRYSTAHVYKNALFSFSVFCGTCNVSFRQITRESLRLYGQYLYENGLKLNTISTYMLDSAMVKIDRLRSVRKSQPGCPDYLLDILCGDKSRKDEKAYREYQSALRWFNNSLKELARALHLKSPVTSYTLRHSWATIAKYRGVSIEMISEALGHKSIKTTQTYLKGFGLEERTEVNKGNLSYIRNCNVKG